MLQHVNKVLIAKTAPASYTTVDALVDGDIALFNENKVIVKSTSEAEAATANRLWYSLSLLLRLKTK